MSKTTPESDLWKDAQPSTFENAKYLRQNLTEAEQLLWINLRNRRLGGFKFRRQHPLSSFVADFYCHEAKLVVELDGKFHQEAEQKAYDEHRTAALATLGIQVIRFSNEAVLQNMSEVLKEIRKHLTPDPSP